MSTNKPKLSLDELERLYTEEKWPTARIAERAGLTRRALQARLRLAGVAFDRNIRVNSRRLVIERETLRAMYEDEGLTIDQIGERLERHRNIIRQAMDAHNIKRRPRNQFPRKHPSVADLKIGESFTVPLKNKKMRTFGFFHKQAKDAGIRIVIRRKDPNTAIVIRTPVMSADAILDMLKAGMSKIAIARTFFVGTRAISRLMVGLPEEFVRRESPLSNLKIGDSIILSKRGRKGARFNALYKIANRLGIRIVIRRSGKNAVITRTPLFTRDVVGQIWESGTPRAAIAKVFYSSTGTISRMLREMSISLPED